MTDSSTPPNLPDPQATAHGLAQSVDLVRSLIESGLLSPEALGLAPSSRAPLVPGERIRVAAMVDKSIADLPANTRRAYAGYMRLLVNGCSAGEWNGESDYPGIGDLWVDEVLTSDLNKALKVARGRAVTTSRHRGEARELAGRKVRDSTGEGAVYNAVGAWRRLFKDAIKDRHLAEGYNPATALEKPKRIKARRKALTAGQLNELYAVVGMTGDDPELDTLICDTILIAGARQEGILNMTLGGISARNCTVRLDEKFGKVTDQPVPDWFVERLLTFARSRGALRHHDPVFVKRPVGKRPGGHITPRRFNNLFGDRVQSRLDWADEVQVTAHLLRHHSIKVVERAAGKSVSLAFARHEPEDVNDSYSAADPAEVAAAIVRIYGGKHPWAQEVAE